MIIVFGAFLLLLPALWAIIQIRAEEKAKDDAKRQALLSKKQSQIKEENENKLISSKFGNKEKYLCMTSIRKEMLKEASAQMANLGLMYVSSIKDEKEHSWGLAGGIAQGLAGPAAGVAAAADVMNENQQIRQRNEQRRHDAEEVRDSLYDMSTKALEESISSDMLKGYYNYTVIEDPRDIFKDMDFRYASVDIDSETDTVSVSVTYMVPARAIVKGYVDGAIRAKLYDQRCKLCGSVEMPLNNNFDPKYDPCSRVLSRNIKGIACDIGHCGKLTVKLEPIHLWYSMPKDKEPRKDSISKEEYMKIAKSIHDAYIAELNN